MQLLRSDIDIQFFTGLFPGVEFSLYRSDDAGHFISCFVARFSDSKSCEKYWGEITSEIAINFQADLNNDFASWNIYLLLVCPENIDKHLKYKIENDRFALRKILVTLQKNESQSDDQIIEVLEDAILGRDLKIGVTSSTESMPIYMSEIRKKLAAIPRIPLDGKDISIQIRRQQIAELMERVQGI